MKERDWDALQKKKRWEGAKRYLRYCRGYSSERAARNYTRNRYRLSFEEVGKLVKEVDKEDK